MNSHPEASERQGKSFSVPSTMQRGSFTLRISILWEIHRLKRLYVRLCREESDTLRLSSRIIKSATYHWSKIIAASSLESSKKQVEIEFASLFCVLKTLMKKPLKKEKFLTPMSIPKSGS